MNPNILPPWSYGEDDWCSLCDGQCMCRDFCDECQRHESVCDCPVEEVSEDICKRRAA